MPSSANNCSTFTSLFLNAAIAAISTSQKSVKGSKQNSPFFHLQEQTEGQDWKPETVSRRRRVVTRRTRSLTCVPAIIAASHWSSLVHWSSLLLTLGVLSSRSGIISDIITNFIIIYTFSRPSAGSSLNSSGSLSDILKL